MIHSLPTKILIGISLDAHESKELLSWAIKILAHPGDTIVALHVIVPNKRDNMKRHSARKHQRQFRQAKSFVISIMGELVKTCQSSEVNLEARVGLSSSPGKGLIEEAKTIGADYVVIGRSRRNKPNRAAPTTKISDYICKNAPDGCSLVLVRTNIEGLKQEIEGESNSTSSRLSSEKNSSYTENSFSSQENEISIDMKSKRQSPTSVLGYEQSSNTGEITTIVKKPKSTFKSISHLFRMLTKQKIHYNALFEKQKLQQSPVRCFSYQEIANATNNFHIENKVGQGGYSEVYRGELGNGSSIAVKRLSKDNNSNANKEKEFLNELGVIGHVNHPNTATLAGYCIDNGLYLVFDFYPNGTLSSALHGQTSKSLDWPTRYNIILGIAKGLHYLHKRCKRRIIHRDIKASNVLLGPDYNPQISDFGLAKWLPNKWSHHAVIPIEGTFGYLAPEYFMHGIVDEKTDVFAFGILILEIITGRRPVDPTRQNLLLWARPLMESGKLSELADPKLRGRYDMDQLFRVALTASYCVRQSSIYRPPMTEVIELLTHDRDSELGRVGWRIPKFTSDEMDDYSMIFGYQLPSDLSLDDI
ncbi:hypothetical protein CASFOL_032681 [Castilleja foliolosa]|uniref:Protein kinase domain-containing protein n=1 Tax=Castilleja foliolosa TaxID=1961234 RepID=A0ABD3C273_9LAMI